MRKWRIGREFLFQEAVTAIGVNVSRDFTRVDILVKPGFAAGGPRGLVIDPRSQRTHPDGARDAMKRAKLASVGLKVIYIDDYMLTAEPKRVIELALGGVDVSIRRQR